MSSSPLNAPWTEFRMIAEQIGQAVADAMTVRAGTNIELGLASSCEPEHLLAGRAVPIRATIVRFQRPLRDVLIFLTSQRDDVVRPLIEAAAEATIATLDVPTGGDSSGHTGQWTIEEVVEYDDRDEAIDQCNALFLEPVMSLDLPMGEVSMIVGTGLLESASCFVNGVRDPHAEEQPLDGVGGPARLVLGDQIDADSAAGLETSDGSIAASTPSSPGELQLAAAADAILGDDAALPAGSGLEAFDAMLAQQEAAERSAAAALAGSGSGVAAANAAAAATGAPPHVEPEATERWTQLLSGVEVELSAELGRTNLPLGQITSLVTDSVLTLEQGVDEPVGVFVNGTLYATARLVVVDNEYGIEILEVVDQSQLAIAAPLAA